MNTENFSDIVAAGKNNNPIANYFLGYYRSDSIGVSVARKERGNFGDILSLVYIAPDSNVLGGTDEIESGLEIALWANYEEPLFFASKRGISFEEAEHIRIKLFGADLDIDFNDICNNLEISFVSY